MKLTAIRAESAHSHAAAVRRAIDDARHTLGEIREAWLIERTVETRAEGQVFHAHVLFRLSDGDALSNDPEAESESTGKTDPPTEEVDRANDDVHDPAR